MFNQEEYLWSPDLCLIPLHTVTYKDTRMLDSMNILEPEDEEHTQEEDSSGSNDDEDSQDEEEEEEEEEEEDQVRVN